MATTTTVFVGSKYLENVQTDQYIAVGVKAIIDSVTITNSSTNGANVTFQIVPVSGSASSSNVMVSNHYLSPGESYSCPELVGHVLRPNEKLSGICTVASAVVLRVSGREIS